jgi:transcriptional regulator with XRE-family HTH domain
MRKPRNPISTTLGVLRNILELEQKEMAGLLGYSRGGLQKVEQRRGKITIELAAIASEATGIHAAWIMGHDLSNPIACNGQPFSKQFSELYRAYKIINKSDRRKMPHHIGNLIQLFAQMCRITLAAFEQGKLELATFRITCALHEIGLQFPGRDAFGIEMEDLYLKTPITLENEKKLAEMLRRLEEELERARKKHKGNIGAELNANRL